MNIESLRDYCLSLPEVTESFPFDQTTLVFKVKDKMFLLTDLEDLFSICVKCDPDLALELREHFACVKPGYHMNKQHWNTIVIDGTVGDQQLIEWINHSYNLVAKRKKKQD